MLLLLPFLPFLPFLPYRLFNQPPIRHADSCHSACVCRLSSVPLFGSVLPASAQIYTWRDANGNLVLSDRRPTTASASVRSYEVPKTQAIRATRYVAAERSRPFEDLILVHAREQGVRPDLVRAVMQVESAFNPRARSPKGALGLMQLMPATARQYGVVNAFDPDQNVRGGVSYLRALLDRYDNDKKRSPWPRTTPARTPSIDMGRRCRPYRETRNYVAQINRMAGAGKSEASTGARQSHLQGDRDHRRPSRRPLHRPPTCRRHRPKSSRDRRGKQPSAIS